VLAPVQRDGAFFLFMAQNIAFGQPAYWATFETKNPLVEYFWAGAYLLSPGNPTIIQAARFAEHAWIVATAMCLALVCFVARRAPIAGRPVRHVEAVVVSGVVGATYLLLVSHYQVVDDGFNIAIYTTLPEAVAILLLLAGQPDRSWWRIALGVALFSAWFVKQTSGMTLALPAVTALMLAPRFREFFRGIVVATVIAGALAGAFFVSLWSTGTLDEYWLAAVQFKGVIASKVTFARFLDGLHATLAPPRGIRDTLARFPAILLYLVPLVTIVWVTVLARERRVPAAGTYGLPVAVLCAWFLGSTLQAVLSLLFFRHYFISAIGPALVAIAALCLRSTTATRTAAIGLAAVSAALVADYRGLGDITRTRSVEAPINRTVAEIAAVVPREATVFLWGGLPHHLLERGRPSDYPQNMWWPYIIEGLNPAERDARLHAVLSPSPPEYVVEFFETYPPEQALVPVRLDAELLRSWTGQRYVVVLETAARPGRYGVPARVFRRMS
jgi:hypothetical protein